MKKEVLVILIICVALSGCASQKTSTSKAPFIENSRYISDVTVSSTHNLTIKLAKNVTYTDEWCRHDPAIGQMVCTPQERATDISSVTIITPMGEKTELDKLKTYEGETVKHPVSPGNYTVRLNFTTSARVPYKASFTINEAYKITEYKSHN